MPHKPDCVPTLYSDTFIRVGIKYTLIEFEVNPCRVQHELTRVSEKYRRNAGYNGYHEIILGDNSRGLGDIPVSEPRQDHKENLNLHVLPCKCGYGAEQICICNHQWHHKPHKTYTIQQGTDFFNESVYPISDPVD